jgi:Predicted periplasmic protein
MPKKILLAAAFLAALVSGEAARAAGPAGFARSFASSPALQFDLAMNDAARPVPSKTKAPALTPEGARQLLRVNRAVNRSVAAMDAYFDGFAPDVAAATGTQDCRSCAELKRERLAALGWPAASMRLAYALTNAGKVERVLLIATDRGDVLLGQRISMVGKRDNDAGSSMDVWAQASAARQSRYLDI